MQIRPFQPADLQPLQLLFREYAESVGNAICFQSFEAEVAALPGVYSPPHGEIFLADEAGELAGCAALRPITSEICEMKRLYVRPGFRGSGLGRSLAEQIIALAAGRGYRAIRLDTLPAMDRAIELYCSLGFQKILPYGENPLSALFFERPLPSTVAKHPGFLLN